MEPTMRQSLASLLLGMLAALCLGVTTATAASGDKPQPGDVVLSPPAGGAVSQKSSPPPLQLTDAQRARIKQVLSGKNSEVSFLLKTTKAAKSFDAKLGEKLPSGLKEHALPQPLISEMPELKRYAYLKFKEQVLIINPMTHKIVDMFPES
jgi:hypothetical protein